MALLGRYVAQFVCTATYRRLPDLQGGHRLGPLQSRSMDHPVAPIDGSNKKDKMDKKAI